MMMSSFLILLVTVPSSFAFRGEFNSESNTCDGRVRHQIVECGDVSGPVDGDGDRSDLDPEFRWLGKRLPGLKADRTRVPSFVLSQSGEGQRTDLRGSSFQDCQMAGVIIRGAYGRDSNFTSSYMRGADLTSSGLDHSNFTSVDLQGAKLRRTRMVGAQLRSTNLNDADLSGANFEGARNFDRASFRGARFDEFTVFPFGEGSELAARQKAIEKYGMVFVSSMDPNPRPSATPTGVPRSDRGSKPPSTPGGSPSSRPGSAEAN